jgi:hypothetical protein
LINSYRLNTRPGTLARVVSSFHSVVVSVTGCPPAVAWRRASSITSFPPPKDAGASGA